MVEAVLKHLEFLQAAIDRMTAMHRILSIAVQTPEEKLSRSRSQ